MATFTVQDTTEPTIDVMAADTTECDGLVNNDQLMAWLANHGGANASDPAAPGGVELPPDTG